MKLVRAFFLASAAFLCSPALAAAVSPLTVDDLLGEWSAEGAGLDEVYSCDAPVRINVKTDADLAVAIAAPDWASTLKKREGPNGQAELYDPETGATRITVKKYIEDTLLFTFVGGRFDGKSLVLAPCY